MVPLSDTELRPPCTDLMSEPFIDGAYRSSRIPPVGVLLRRGLSFAFFVADLLLSSLTGGGGGGGGGAPPTSCLGLLDRELRIVFPVPYRSSFSDMSLVLPTHTL